VRITVVGPAHPLKGGVAQHTTVLARELVARGHEVVIESWRRQYPSRLYPGQPNVQAPEFEPFEPIRRRLSWNRPDSWWRVGRSARSSDLLVIAHVTPVQVPAYRTVLAARAHAVSTVVLAHNVLPHERSLLDRSMVRNLFQAADRVVTHSEAEGNLARSLTSTPVAVTAMAPHMPDGFRPSRPLPGVHRRLLFFGLVRPYKGLDVALRALAAGPKNVVFRVAGEFWEGLADTEQLIQSLGLTGRVELRPQYVPAKDVAALFADVDALVLPYRNATGSQGVWIGFQFGVPVIATAGPLARHITAGIDGLLAEPDDPSSLAQAFIDFYGPGTPERLRSAVRPVDPGPYWDRYLRVLTGLPAAPDGSD